MRGACMREPSPRAVVAENGSVYEQLHAKEAEAATAAGGKKKTSLLVSWRWYEGSPVPALSLESAANLACAAAKASNIN